MHETETKHTVTQFVGQKSAQNFFHLWEWWLSSLSCSTPPLLLLLKSIANASKFGDDPKAGGANLAFKKIDKSGEQKPDKKKAVEEGFWATLRATIKKERNSFRKKIGI